MTYPAYSWNWNYSEKGRLYFSGSNSAGQELRSNRGLSAGIPALFLTALMTWLMMVSPALPAGGQSNVLRRVPVPSSFLRQGEVRLVKEGDILAVQSLLYSKFMGRVRDKIIGNEVENWPEGSEAFEDMKKYRALLEQAVEHAEEMYDQGDRAPGMKRPSLLIEFARGPENRSIRFYEVEIESPCSSSWTVKNKRMFLEMEPIHSDYVDRNQELILQDSFGVDQAVAQAWIESAMNQADQPGAE